MTAKVYNPLVGNTVSTRKEETLKLNCILGGETDRAIHVTFVDGETADGEKDNAWFPLSQVRSIHRTRSIVNNTTDSIVITMWIARQKGLV